MGSVNEMSDNDNIPPELLKFMSPKEVEEYLIMMNDIENLGPHQWELLRSQMEDYLDD